MISMLCSVALALSMQAAEPLEEAARGVVTAVLEEEPTPAAAIIIVTEVGDAVIEVGGVKQLGGSVAAVADDPWHIGSNGKAMTATLAMALSEDGLISLETTVTDVLGGSMKVDDRWSDVTLRMLLTHRSGIQPNIGTLQFLRYTAFGASGEAGPSKDRRSALKGVLKRPPEGTPGEAYLYSNLGYSLAGMMLETVAGQPFEVLIRERLFDPLGMEGGRLGTPKGAGEDVFRGHRGDPLEVSPAGADNPPVMSPAGTWAFPLDAYAKFLADQLLGQQGEPALLSDESYRQIRTPMVDGEDYGLGWGLREEGRLQHSGSNTMWFVTSVVAPEEGVAVSILTNSGEVRGLGARIDDFIEEHFPDEPTAAVPMAEPGEMPAP
ncbi:MAG: serine hydrolase domain-containing protein [Pseudomonadota bacterium]